MATESLRSIADRARTILLENVKSSGNSDIDEGVMAATTAEIEKGLLIGPLSASALPAGSTLTRRFRVLQKGKVRPIDDYKASLVSSSVTQVETVTIHGIDHIACLSAQMLKDFSSHGRAAKLLAKCWDLASAYKQVPLSDEAHELDSYIVVYNPSTGQPEIYQQSVLPFGSVASVTAFLRCALGIWAVGSKLLKLTWTSYFDDFPSLTTCNLARHTEMCVSTLFHLLGWKLSEDKLVPYDECCKVLGVELNLVDSPFNKFTVCNTQSRRDELMELIQNILNDNASRRAMVSD